MFLRKSYWDLDFAFFEPHFTVILTTLNLFHFKIEKQLPFNVYRSTSGCEIQRNRFFLNKKILIYIKLHFYQLRLVIYEKDGIDWINITAPWQQVISIATGVVAGDQQVTSIGYWSHIRYQQVMSIRYCSFFHCGLRRLCHFDLYPHHPLWSKNIHQIRRIRKKSR